MATETVPEPQLRGTQPVVALDGEQLTAVDAAGLRLLVCAASVVFLVCLLILPAGPSESDETLSWILAFAVALPAGLLLATYQARWLAAAAPAAPARGVAAGTALLAAAFVLRRFGTGDQLHHMLIAVAAAGALAAPVLAAWLWRDPTDRETDIARVIAIASVVLITVLFVPDGALQLDTLIPALALAALAFLLVSLHPRRQLSVGARRAVDVVLCGVIALLAIQLPDIAAHAENLVENHGFFLGPANDVLHGRAMLGGAWSQYGVGSIDALALVFTVVPIGFGTFALVIAALTAALYLCVYVTLRLAGLGQVLAALTVVVAAVGNLFAPLDVYVSYPSDTPLRFGLPYLMVLFAVAGARYPARARPMRVAVLAVMAIAAAWSFETFLYCGGTYGALVLVEAIDAGTQVVRRIIRGAILGLAASAAAVALLSLVTFLLAGSLDWGPYFDYIRLYTFEGFSQLPVIFFSPGPLMAAAIFASAVILLWLVRERRETLSPAMRVGLTGFTGLAVITFTYYLGRSHPNNLLILLVPVVALGGLWTHLLLRAPVARWRTAAVATIVVAGAMLTVSAWPSVKQEWGDTALALEIPGGGRSLQASLDRLADNPVLEGKAPSGVALLAGHLPPHAPALVLTEPDLTTEILMRAGRRNVLPMSNPREDDLIASSRGRVLAAVERISAGTLMLTSPDRYLSGEVPSVGMPGDFNELQRAALTVLRRRFAFRLIERTPEGLELVRLASKG